MFPVKSVPLKSCWDSPSSVCCFHFEDGEGNKHIYVMAVSGLLGSIKVAIDAFSRTAERCRLILVPSTVFHFFPHKKFILKILNFILMNCCFLFCEPWFVKDLKISVPSEEK